MTTFTGQSASQTQNFIQRALELKLPRVQDQITTFDDTMSQRPLARVGLNIRSALAVDLV